MIAQSAMGITQLETNKDIKPVEQDSEETDTKETDTLNYQTQSDVS